MSWWTETQGSRQTLGTYRCRPSSIVHSWYLLFIRLSSYIFTLVEYQLQCMLHNHSQLPRGPCPSPRFSINQRCLETSFRSSRMSTVSPPCILHYLISQRLLGNARRRLILQSSNHSRPLPCLKCSLRQHSDSDSEHYHFSPRFISFRSISRHLSLEFSLDCSQSRGANLTRSHQNWEISADSCRSGIWLSRRKVE